MVEESDDSEDKGVGSLNWRFMGGSWAGDDTRGTKIDDGVGLSRETRAGLGGGRFGGQGAKGWKEEGGWLVVWASLVFKLRGLGFSLEGLFFRPALHFFGVWALQN